MKQKRTQTNNKKHNMKMAVGGVFSVGVFSLLYFGVPLALPTTYEGDVAVEEKKEQTEEFVSDKKYLETPEPLRAIYMSQCVAGTPSFRNDLVELIEETDLNAVVIDVKDYSGTIGFPTKDPRFEEATLKECGAYDMEEFLSMLHDKGIYTIARITVFQDPHYTSKFPAQAVQSVSRPGEPWKDNKGLSFVDVSSKPFWDYIATLSKEARAIGFDELNFDYIRYPSDGPMADAQYVNPNKPEAVEQFFAYLNQEIKKTGAVMSADLFGMTTTNFDDLSIGQQLERALPHFDYIAPMVYPSHYPPSFLGLGNPNSDPYLVVNYSMKEAVKRAIANTTKVQTLSGEPIFKEEVVPATAETATTTKQVFTGLYTKEKYNKLVLRPWLQDFDYGGDYDVEEVRAQIDATYDAGLTSWMLWAPSNRYTKGALFEPKQEELLEEAE